MDKLSKKDVLPRSLFINDVKKEQSEIGVGGFGTVYKGEYEGQKVALKMLYKARNKEGSTYEEVGAYHLYSSDADPFTKDSLRKDFCREALTWWSLLHDFILPLSGIYEMNAKLYLVSPYMANGALEEWRKKHRPGVIDIRRMVRFLCVQ